MALPHGRGEPTVGGVQAAGDADDGARGEGAAHCRVGLQRTMDCDGRTPCQYVPNSYVEYANENGKFD